MTTQTNFPMNDLVLRLSGGHRDGELIPVSTKKCFLGMEADSHGVEQNPQCAIFRGPKGAAVRSYADAVLVNGVASTVHWLKEGDRIAFPNSMTVEVAQLGWVEAQNDSVVEESSNCDSEQESVCEPVCTEASGTVDCDMQTPLSSDKNESTVPSQIAEPIVAELEQPVPPNVDATEVTSASDQAKPETDLAVEMAQYDERLGNVEIQIRDILASSELTQSRFDGLDSRIEDLVGQLSKLMANQNTNQDANVSTDNDLGASGFFTESSLQETSVQRVDETESEPVNKEESFAEYYSHKDDDDEKIMTFDSTVEEADPPAVVPENVEVTDVEPVSNAPTKEEMEQRLVEMERVFGNAFAEEETSAADENPPATNDVPETQSVNEQPLEASETLTHSQDSEVALFTDTSPEVSALAGNSISAVIESPETENSDTVGNDSTVDSFKQTELEPGSLASQLLAEVAASEAEMSEHGVVEPELVVPELVEPELVEPAATDSPQPEPEVPSNESVADLLARMKLDAAGEEDSEPQPNEPPAPPIQPEPVSLASPVGEEKPDDVEDYMNQLLTRMRGGQPAAPKPEPKKPTAPTAEVSEENEESFVPPSDPLTQAEFIPKQKATKLKSLDAMRELANSSARKAVQHSEGERLKALGYTQLGIAIASFLMALYYFFIDSQGMFDMGFCIALICLATSGYLGTRFYNTMKHNERVAIQPIVSATKNEPAA